MAVCAPKKLVVCLYSAVVMPDVYVWTINVTKCDDSYGTHFSTAAGSEVEMKDQQIQTETSETEHKDVQVGSITSPPESVCFSDVCTAKKLLWNCAWLPL